MVVLAVKSKIVSILLLCLVVLPAVSLAAQGTSPNAIDTQCVTDDENFTKFLDFLALSFSAMGCLFLPIGLPLVPGVTNRWRWASPAIRWASSVVIVCGLGFLVLVFLPPQLARVSTAFRPSGLALFHALGNVRLEYLSCDLQALPRDYGLFFLLRWNPGADLMLGYWWAQLLVFCCYCTLFSLLYFALTYILARRRLVALAQ